MTKYSKYESLFFFLYYIACLQDFAGGLLWPASTWNRVVTQSCSILHPSFRSRVDISRKCNENDTWGPVDDSKCTALSNAIPTIMISFEMNVTHNNAQCIVDNVSFKCI